MKIILMAWTCTTCGTVYSDGITYCRQCAAKN